MVIKASKFLIISKILIINVVLLLPCLIYLYFKAGSMITLFEGVSIFIGSFIAFTLVSLLTNNEDIEVIENMIGGQSLTSYRGNEKQFIDRNDIDPQSNKNRTFIDRVTGVHKVYDSEGKGFYYNQHHFFRAELDKIASHIKT